MIRAAAIFQIIAYHYREAIQLSRQSAVPLALPFKTEDAAHIFARAGVPAGHTGSYAETQSQMQMAISLTPEHKRMQLYEQRKLEEVEQELKHIH